MIRSFRNGDIRACANVIESCLHQDANLAPAIRNKLAGGDCSLSLHQNASLFYLAVYEFEGEIAGIGGLDLNEIRLLYVSPERQRQGIGRVLLDHLESMIPVALFANIFVYSTPVAESFYRKRGYQSRGEVFFEVEGQPLPTIFMSKPLSAPELRPTAPALGEYSPWK